MRSIWSSGDLDALEEVVATECVARFPGQEPVQGREGYAQTIRMFRSAFADFSVEDHDVVAEGDTVCRFFTVTGTHEGEFLGVPPTGNEIEVPGMNLARFEDGLVVEEITCADLLGTFQQLGAIERSAE